MRAFWYILIIFVFTSCGLCFGGVLPYKIEILGEQVSPHAINNKEVVVGSVRSGNAYIGFVWDRQNNLRELAKYGDSYFIPYSINDFSQMTGQAGDGVFLDRDGYVLIGDVTWPAAINNNGIVTGTTRLGGEPYEPFIWSKINGMLRIKGFSQYNSFGFDINNEGQVVGRSEVIIPAGINNHAFIWEDINHNGKSDDGEMKDLGTLLSGNWSEAYGINNYGKVVGVSHIGGDIFNTEAFIWGEANGMKSLGFINLYWGSGNIPGMNMSINDLDQVVFSNSSMNISYYWDPINGMIDIYQLLYENNGWSRLTLASINNNGQIVGWGNYNGRNTGFIMTPIPEPGTFFLLAVGALALRNKKQIK